MSHPNTELEQENIEAPPSPDSPPPQIPPTNPPRTPAIDEKYERLLKDTIAEQNRRIAELEASQTREPAPPPKPELTPEERRQAFYNDPEAATREVIRAELDATVSKLQPLLDFASRQQGTTVLDKLINNAKANPKIGPHWNNYIENYVREQSASVDPSRLNDRAIEFLALSAIGMKTAGFFPDDQPNNPDPNPAPRPNPDRTTPPYIPPSPAPVPTPQPTNKFKPLNENERRILREYNAGKKPADQMTEAQYREWQSLPASEVATTTFDKPKK